MKMQRPIGTYDITPDEAAAWSQLETQIRSMFGRYNYGEIRTPVFEYTELFQRGVGEASDIVAKEMYTFKDRGDRSLTLRPEGTAGVVRAYIENGLEKKNPGITKLFYIAPMFRYERKQRGRFRQHVQYGCEVFGADGPDIDIELLVMLNLFYQGLGLHQLDLKINSVGCPVCRPPHRDEFVSWAKPYLKEFCEDCLRRFESNPLRMFDCKVARCQEILQHAPRLLDKLCETCQPHFDGLQAGLTHHNIKYEVDSKLVRGLDYYTRSAFEMSYAPLGSQGVLMGGGRYDGLVDYLGGSSTTGIGFGAGMERLVMILEETGNQQPANNGMDLFVVVLGENAAQAAGDLLVKARSNGLRCDRDFTGKSMKKQIQMAAKLGAKFAAIIGDNEIENKVIVLKNLSEGSQQEIPWSDDLSELQTKISI